MVFSDFFQGLNDAFSIKRPVTAFSTPDFDEDTRKTTQALSKIGHMSSPKSDLGDGLKSFQADNGLKVDGIMKPGGPTEKALSHSLSQNSIGNSDLLAKKEEPVQPAAKIEKPASPKPKTSSFSSNGSFSQPLSPAKPKKPKIGPLTGRSDPLATSPIAKKSKAEMDKLWEQAAELQKPKTAIVPKGNTVDDRIKSIMEDPRYLKKREKPIVDHVVKQFERAYPGNIKHDETGKMIWSEPVIKPEDVEPFDPDGELQNDQAQTHTFKSATQELPQRNQTRQTDTDYDDDKVYPQSRSSQPKTRTSNDGLAHQIPFNEDDFGQLASLNLDQPGQMRGYQVAQADTGMMSDTPANQIIMSPEEIISLVRSGNAKLGYNQITRLRAQSEEGFQALPDDVKNGYQEFINLSRSSEPQHLNDLRNEKKAVSRGLSEGAQEYTGQDMSNTVAEKERDIGKGLGYTYGADKSSRDRYDQETEEELKKSAIPDNYQGRTMAKPFGEFVDLLPGFGNLITAKEYGELAEQAGFGEGGSQAAAIAGLFSGKAGKIVSKYGTQGADYLVKSIMGKSLSEATPELAKQIKDQLIEQGVDKGLRKAIENALP